MVLLETRALTKYFGALAAVQEVDLRLEAGTRQAIIGPNGAGKTTLLNLLMGQIAATRGHIWFQGTEITGLSSHRIARLGIAKTFQKPQLFAPLSVYENVRAAVHVGQSLWYHPSSVQEDTWSLLQHLDLAERAHVPAAELAHGEQKRLEIGMALGQRPRLLLLDEPVAGLSRSETAAMVQLITALHDTTILMVEHDMQVVMRVAEMITVMHQGRIVAQGSPVAIQADSRVQEIYLRTA